jgi:23S rRNA (cytosine1962-C5)-methyltransferase
MFAAPIGQLLDEAFARKHAALAGEKCFRWIFSESDLLPGLVVDLFDRHAVAQLQTASMEWIWPFIKETLQESFRRQQGAELESIVELRKGIKREQEGLENATSPATTAHRTWHRWNGLEWSMAPGQGQKTGAYFDQHDNHRRAVHWASALGCQRAWDLCSFEGGFGLHLARAGLEVLAIDVSAPALEVARANAARNGIAEERYRTQQVDVFEFLRSRFDERARVPMIVLDPPSFSKSKNDAESALKGFKELNLRAFHGLEPKGLLISCACSHSISRHDYGEMLRSAAHDARRSVHVLEICGPSPDHAPLLGFPESEYLQAWFLEIQ